MPGACKLDHLQPIEPILFQNIFNFFAFILGGQFLLPQRANNGKREFIQLQNWMRQRGFGAWDIQTGPFPALCTSHILKSYQLFHLHTGRPMLITPEGQHAGKSIFPTPEMDMTEGFQCKGHSSWTICSLLSQFYFPNFTTFSFSYWRPILITPEG